MLRTRPQAGSLILTDYYLTLEYSTLNDVLFKYRSILKKFLLMNLVSSICWTLSKSINFSHSPDYINLKTDHELNQNDNLYFSQPNFVCCGKLYLWQFWWDFQFYSICGIIFREYSLSWYEIFSTGISIRKRLYI